VKHSELLEQHEARLRLYVSLFDGIERSPVAEEAREIVLDLVRKEIEATDMIAETHLRRLPGDEQREAFRYTLALLLPYYTHLARLYRRPNRAPSMQAGRRSET
jgi:hypothetical protein